MFQSIFPWNLNKDWTILSYFLKHLEKKRKLIMLANVDLSRFFPIKVNLSLKHTVIITEFESFGYVTFDCIDCNSHNVKCMHPKESGIHKIQEKIIIYWRFTIIFLWFELKATHNNINTNILHCIVSLFLSSTVCVYV